MMRLLIVAAAASLLVACGEKPQTATGARSDAPAYTGTGKPYAEKGWKQGDKASWESQLKARGANGQNEYQRTN
ncbi:MAG: hypothetical protein ACO3AC_11455 [Hylemonella sp.]|jgi:major membrane immunogen (membrane-anchored lipoprotein)